MHVTAHISDLHIHDARSVRRARAVMRHLRELPGPLDAILATGDLADHGLAGEYEELAKLLVAPVPVLHCPGNHDIRGPYREHLLGEPADDGPINQQRTVAGVRYLLCDSTIPGQDPGRLDDTTLAWLSACLSAEPQTPTYVCFHHPPVTLGMDYVDGMRQFHTDGLAELLKQHRQVAAVLCGHAHTGASTRFAGVPLLVAPGVTSTANLNFESDQIVDLDAPPAVSFHIRHDDGRITTHIRFVDPR